MKLLVFLAILAVAVEVSSDGKKLEDSEVWKLVKKLTIYGIKDLMVHKVDCEKNYKYCQSKRALIEYVNGLADEESNHLKREHCEYLINEVIEKNYHLLNRDEL